jgi:hypothetical protein
MSDELVMNAARLRAEPMVATARQRIASAIRGYDLTRTIHLMMFKLALGGYSKANATAMMMALDIGDSYRAEWSKMVHLFEDLAREGMGAKQPH